MTTKQQDGAGKCNGDDDEKATNKKKKKKKKKKLFELRLSVWLFANHIQSRFESAKKESASGCERGSVKQRRQ